MLRACQHSYSSNMAKRFIELSVPKSTSSKRILRSIQNKTLGVIEHAKQKTYVYEFDNYDRFEFSHEIFIINLFIEIKVFTQATVAERQMIVNSKSRQCRRRNLTTVSVLFYNLCNKQSHDDCRRLLIRTWSMESMRNGNLDEDEWQLNTPATNRPMLEKSLVSTRWVDPITVSMTFMTMVSSNFERKSKEISHNMSDH
jgi:hypothetical protein